MAKELIDNAAEFARRRAEQAIKEEATPKKIVPRHLWVLIRKVEPKDVLHESGIVETRGQSRSQLGEVVAVGEEVTNLTAGDLVIYTNFPIELEDVQDLTGDRKLHLIRDEEVYAKVVEDGD